MSDLGEVAPQSSGGHMLRAAREQRGLHIAVVAAAVKVPQRKLEALEADRYQELPDITFARALAQAVCRYLKVDAAPVLARLPQTGGEQAQGLVHVSNGLASPYRESPSHQGRDERAWLSKPMFWATALVLLAAAILAFLPDNLWRSSGLPVPQPGASGVAAADPASPVMPPPSVSPELQRVSPADTAGATTAAPIPAPPSAEAPSAPALAEVSGRGALLRATDVTWVEARDATGRVLLSRTLQANETVELDAALPLRLTIGNARATQVSFQGRPVDLAPATGRDNVARLELK